MEQNLHKESTAREPKAMSMIAIPITKKNTEGRWADEIQSAWQKSVESTIKVGQLLVDAKDALPHGGFESMIEERLPFSASTARRLMAIAANPVIANRAHGHVLPASWRTLYDLSRLNPPLLDLALADGRVHPDMSRKDVGALDPSVKKKTKPNTDITAKVTVSAGTPSSASVKRRLTARNKRIHKALYTGLASAMGAALREVMKEDREIRDALPSWRAVASDGGE